MQSVSNWMKNDRLRGAFYDFTGVEITQLEFSPFSHSLDETFSCKNETLLVVQKVIAFWTRRMWTNRFIKSLYGICRTLVYTAVRHKYNRLPYISRAQEWKNDPPDIYQAKPSQVWWGYATAWLYKYLEVIAKNHDWDYPLDSAFKYTAYLYD